MKNVHDTKRWAYQLNCKSEQEGNLAPAHETSGMSHLQHSTPPSLKRQMTAHLDKAHPSANAVQAGSCHKENGW